MERISIFNYEAFYLDFLEGNLNEEDTALLLDFLEKHPDLMVDTEEWPVLESPTVSIDATFINGLKQTDHEVDAVSAANVEQFIIAAIEGQLSENKLRELQNFADHNEEVAALWASYEKLKLVPDLSVTYGDTKDLKRRKTIVLWPSVAVAASILAFALIYSVWKRQAETTDSQQPKWAKEHNNDIQNGNNKDVKSIQNMPLAHEKQSDSDTVAPERNRVIYEANEQVASLHPNVDKRRPKFAEVGILEKHNATYNGDGLDREISIAALPPVRTKTPESNQQDEGYLALNEMKNPIKPVTKRLSEFTDTDIEVRTAKTTQEAKGGFYVKIGKFEIEHHRRKPKRN